MVIATPSSRALSVPRSKAMDLSYPPEMPGLDKVRID